MVVAGEPPLVVNVATGAVKVIVLVPAAVETPETVRVAVGEVRVTVLVPAASPMNECSTAVGAVTVKVLVPASRDTTLTLREVPEGAVKVMVLGPAFNEAGLPPEGLTAIVQAPHSSAVIVNVPASSEEPLRFRVAIAHRPAELISGEEVWLLL